MTSQWLNWATVRGDQCSENVDSFSDKSIVSLTGASNFAEDVLRDETQGGQLTCGFKLISAVISW